MKRIGRGLCCGALAAVMAISLSACSTQGEAGKSAYEIAVEHGFTGTEAEWLDSLKPDAPSYTLDDLYASAREHGFEGSYLEFLREYLDIGEVGIAADLSAEINRAMLSVVSVYSKFTETEVIYGSWGTQQERTETYYSASAGVVYTKDGGDGYVITNYHAVYDAKSDTKISQEIECQLYGMEKRDEYGIPCTYLGGSMQYDLAVLKIEGSDVFARSNVRPTTFADSDAIAVGQTAIAIGNAEAEGISVSSGVVSVDSEYIEMTGVDNVTKVRFRVLRTDATVNKGNSGGGLFNAAGELIGIVNARNIADDVFNIGYAIPSTLVKSVADNIIAHCDGAKNVNVKKVDFGLTLTSSAVRTEYSEATGAVRIFEQVQIAEIASGSLAEGNLQVGDILVSMTIGGTEYPITRLYQPGERALLIRSGDAVTFRVLRGGAYADVPFSIGDGNFNAVL